MTMVQCLLRILQSLLLAVLLFVFPSTRDLDGAQASAAISVPEFGPLSSYRDSSLTVKLERALRKQRGWSVLLNKGRLAVAVVDLSGEKPRFASVNGHVMMYAASLPKIAILLAAYQSFEDGSLIETAAIHNDLAEMIRTSSNSAATRMIDRLGINKIEKVLRDPRYGLYDEKRGGGLWVGKRYAAEGPRRGDPLFNISHGATADQVARFYFLLASGRLINPERSEQMLRDLSAPGLSHKFVASLQKRAPGARLYRKSGTWKRWHSDSILVRGKEWRNYILVALVESTRGGKIIEAMIPVAESVIQPVGAKSHSAPGTNQAEMPS